MSGERGPGIGMAAGGQRGAAHLRPRQMSSTHGENRRSSPRPAPPERPLALPPLALAVALLALASTFERRVASRVLHAYSAEQALAPYTALVEVPACLAEFRAAEVRAALAGQPPPPALDPARCSAAQQPEALRPDAELAAALGALRGAGAAQGDVDALGLELVRARAEAFVGDGMVHLVHTRDVSHDVLRPWLCEAADAGATPGLLPLGCAAAAQAWRVGLALSSLITTVALTWLALRQRNCTLCVRALLCLGLGRLARSAIVLCTTLPLTHHTCRLLAHRTTGDTDAAVAATGEELAACEEQFIRFRATLALTCACLALCAWPPSSSRWLRVLSGCIAAVLVAGVFGESVAMIGYTVDGVGTVIVMAALWWASGPLAALLCGGGGGISESETIAAASAIAAAAAQFIRRILMPTRTHRDQYRDQILALSGNANVQDEAMQLAMPLAVLACGAAVGVVLSTGEAGDDELWCAPLRGWICTAAALELAVLALPAQTDSRPKKTS